MVQWTKTGKCASWSSNSVPGVRERRRRDGEAEEEGGIRGSRPQHLRPPAESSQTVRVAEMPAAFDYGG